MDFKEHIIEKIVDITGLEREVVEKSVEVPPDEKMGDIAFPCFPLAKVMRKAPPIIAQELAEKMSGDDMIEKAQAAGGYLNFFLNREKFISETVSSALDAGEDWGKSDMGKGKTVLVEYSSPNIAKPFHIGHLFSTAVGNSLSKIYKHLGYDVQSLNHLGDWGTQFGKLICAYKRWGVKEVIEKDPINELLKIYVKFHEEAEKHPELDDEARGYFKKLEDGDEETTALWTYFRDISLVEFKRVYDMLGVITAKRSIRIKWTKLSIYFVTKDCLPKVTAHRLLTCQSLTYRLVSCLNRTARQFMQHVILRQLYTVTEHMISIKIYTL